MALQKLILVSAKSHSTTAKLRNESSSGAETPPICSWVVVVVDVTSPCKSLDDTQAFGTPRVFLPPCSIRETPNRLFRSTTPARPLLLWWFSYIQPTTGPDSIEPSISIRNYSFHTARRRVFPGNRSTAVGLSNLTLFYGIVRAN